MSRPATIVRLEEVDGPEPQAAADAPSPAPDQAQIDVAHAQTGWSAYDVWRSRVFVPQPNDYKKPGGTS